MAPVLCLGRSLPISVSCCWLSHCCREKGFPLKAASPKAKAFLWHCWTVKDWHTANSICALLRRPFGGSCTVNVEETELLGRWHSIPCHIPLHPLQVKMQNCSLEGNYSTSTLFNFSSGLACLSYKNLELGRERENSEIREPIARLYLSWAYLLW